MTKTKPKTTLSRRLGKYLFYGVLNLLLLIVAAVIIVPLLIDENDIKAQITKTVLEQTGRELQLDGELKVSVFPWLGAELRDVRLSNAKGFSAESFASLKHIQVRIELIPLTRRELRMDTVTIEGLNLNLERKADGSGNWDDLAQARTKPGSGSGAASTSDAPATSTDSTDSSSKSDYLAVFALGGVDIKNARVQYQDPQQQVQLSNLSVRTGPVSLTGPIDVQLDTHFETTGATREQDLKGNTQVTAQVAFELIEKRYRLENLSADLSLEHAALGASPAKLHLDGGINFDQIAAVLRAQNLKLNLEGVLPGGESSVPVKLVVDTDLELRLHEQTLAMSRLQIKLPELQHGTRKISLDANTLVAGNLKTGQYLLNGFSAKGQLSDPAIGPQPIAYQVNTNLSLDLAGSKLSAKDLRIAADDIKAGGDLNANWDQATPSANGILAIPDVALRSVLERFAIKLPDTRNKKAFSRASMSSRFYVDSQQLKLEELKAGLDASTAKGQLSVVNFAQPEIKYRLSIDTLDADGYLAPAQKGAPPVAIAALPVDTLRALDIDGRLDIGQLKYSGLSLSKVQLGLKADKGLLQVKPLKAGLGKGNYLGHLKIDARKATPTVSMDEQLSNVDLHKLLTTFGVKTGALNLRGGRSNLRLRGQFSSDASGKRLIGKQVSIDGKIAGRSFKGGPIKVAIRSNLDLDLGAKTIALEGLNAAIAEFKTTGSLKASGLDSKPQYDAQLNIAPFNPRKLAKRLGIRLPRTTDKKVLRAISLQTRVRGTTAGLQADPLLIKLDKSKLTGNLTVAGFKKPAIVFDLTVNKLNLDRYLPPQSKRKIATPGAVATVLPLYLVRDLNLNGTLAVNKFKLSGLSMEKVNITAKAKDGLVNLSPLSAKLYQGSYQGNIALDVTQKQPTIKVNEKLSNVRIGKLLRDFNGKAPPVTGAADVHAVLNTQGVDTRVMVEKLNGTLDFAIKNGTLEKVDLVDSMCKALAAIDLGNLNKKTLASGLIGLLASTQSKSKAGTDGDGTTRFTDMRGSAKVKNGVARNDDLLMTSPVVRVTGNGSVDIPASSINYLAKAELVQNCAGIGKRDLSGQFIPVKITGPLDKPKISPQLTAGLVNALRGKNSANNTNPQPSSTQQQIQQVNPEQPVKRGTAIKESRDKVINDLLKGLFK